MRAFFRQYVGSVLDKQALRACFVLFVRELQDRLNTHVFARSELRSLDNVAEEVIAAVYSNEYFHARRPRVREILRGQSFAGWNAFVAQMREAYINASMCPGVPRALARRRPHLTFDQAHPPRNSVESGWNAQWVLDVDEAVWKSGEKAMKREVVVVGGDIRDGSGAVSLFTLFDIISHVVRVEVAINVQARTLHARSTQGTAGILDCMRLVLDGQERVFSMFPNGMASGIDAGRSGDYIGEMRVDQSGRLVVYLQVFNWSIREDSPSYHLRTRIECWRSRRLCISGDVLATTAPFSFYPREASRLGEMSLRDKRKAVD
uniref:Uncharacterized protein n=1 Tax=Phytophthora ramorum TaxID=164328 RepID=H3H790_PHYRM